MKRFLKEQKALLFVALIFLVFYFIPIESEKFKNSLIEGIKLLKWYAREHVLLCLVPAFFIAGAISIFIDKASVMKYLGPGSPKILSLSVASVSGCILAVCSCTVLPLFAGILNMGAGIGPATAFLYSGPAINVLAIVLTARVLGVELGAARAIGAILFSIIIGLLMHFIFIKEEREKAKAKPELPKMELKRPLWQNVIFFASMVFVLIFANFANPNQKGGLFYFIFNNKWVFTLVSAVIFYISIALWFKIPFLKILISILFVAIGIILFPSIPIIPFTIGTVSLGVILYTTKGEPEEWFTSSAFFARQIIPLLFVGVFVAGIFLGTPASEGIIPKKWIQSAVGGNSISSNLFASVAGAFMYFATLTEVPILEGLLKGGMGKGPALALLLSGPALSLPNMLVIRSIMGTKKTIVFIFLVISMATISGMLYGGIC